MKYKPETCWRVTEDGSLVYNLRQYGWKHGKPAMENDVSFVVNATSRELRIEVAKLVRDAMNVNYPVSED